MLIHVPHASTRIPASVRAQLVLGDRELAAELLAMTDRYTDELFAGSYVPERFYTRDTRVRSVMLELRRGLYMDESSGDRNADFEATRSVVTELSRLATAAASASGP